MKYEWWQCELPVYHSQLILVAMRGTALHWMLQRLGLKAYRYSQPNEIIQRSYDVVTSTSLCSNTYDVHIGMPLVRDLMALTGAVQMYGCLPLRNRWQASSVGCPWHPCPP